MVQPHRPIPRQTDVPFHVAVEAEKIAEEILSEVRRVAPADGNAFPFLSVRIDAKHARLALEQAGGICLRDVKPFFRARAIPGHEIKPTIVSAENRVRIVIATGSK